MGRKKANATNGEASIGHNSNLTDDQRKKLSGFVQEIERVDAEARELSSERGTIYKAAKEQGFDTKAVKHVIKLRRMEREARESWENAVDTYRHALGDLADTPLGQAATTRATGGFRSLGETAAGLVGSEEAAH